MSKNNKPNNKDNEIKNLESQLANDSFANEGRAAESDSKSKTYSNRIK